MNIFQRDILSAIISFLVVVYNVTEKKLKNKLDSRKYTTIDVTNGMSNYRNYWYYWDDLQTERKTFTHTLKHIYSIRLHLIEREKELHSEMWKITGAIKFNCTV